MASFFGQKRILLLIVLAIVVLISVVPLVRRPHANTRSQYVVGVPDRGAKLFYGDKQCGICHAVNGSGGRIAPDLSSSEPESPAMGWLAAKVWNHGPAMWRHIRRYNKPFPELEPQEMADILSFLYRASNLDPAGDSGKGHQVFTEKGCAHCHAVGNDGAKTAPELSRIVGSGNSTEWMSAMLNHAGSMVDPITHELGTWPQLSGHEMNDLIAYVTPASAKTAKEQSGDPDLGARVFQDRCAQCHSINGKGGTIGPALGPESNVPLSPARFAGLMWNHAPAMLKRSHETNTPVPQLQKGEMNNLLAFLASVRYFEPSGTAALGKKVFAKRGCASCHGDGAEGTLSGPPLKAEKEPYTAVSFTSALWRHGPHMIDRAEAMGMPWPKLEARDIGDLVSFLNDDLNAKAK